MHSVVISASTADASAAARGRLWPRFIRQSFTYNRRGDADGRHLKTLMMKCDAGRLADFAHRSYDN